jgi:glycosyltransferase involved in cell wall biosynthesis
MRIVQLTNDNREIQRKYHLDEPVFGPAPEALLEGFKALGSDVEIHVVSCLQKMPRRSPAKLADNIFFHPLHVPKIGWLRTGYQGCIRAVRRKLRDIQPDIVHGQGTERDCAMCAVYSGYPNVLTIHGNMRLVAKVLRAKPFTYYWFASLLERHCLRRTDGVVAISSYTERNVSSDTRRSWLLPNAVHPSFFTIRRQPGLPPRILCPANIGTRKNQIGLIEALDPLAKDTCFKLTFAGSGSEKDPYFREFQKLVEARPWCEYLGALDAASLREQMASAFMGILPSLEDNCPMVILEAAASRLPFAASAVGGIPDLITDKLTGLLFDPGKPSSLRQAVAAMISSSGDENSLRLANNAYEQAVARFSAPVVARRHLSVYREAVASHWHSQATKRTSHRLQSIP